MRVRFSPILWRTVSEGKHEHQLLVLMNFIVDRHRQLDPDARAAGPRFAVVQRVAAKADFHACQRGVEFGDVPTHDLAQYHVATNADVERIDAHWIDEDEADLGYAGAKGIGEIGIVGTAAAIANAVHHASGVRIRDLPIRLDKLLG